MQAIGFVEVEKGLLQDDNLVLIILDQRWEGIELYIKYPGGNVRVDYLLEYYFSETVELTKTSYQKKISDSEYFTQFLIRYKENLRSLHRNLHEYLDWERNPKPSAETISQLVSN